MAQALLLIVALLLPASCARTPPAPRPDLLNDSVALSAAIGARRIDSSLVSLHVQKRLRRLTVLYGERKVKEYPVVLGGSPVGDKMREGDQKTPEGDFKLIDCRPHRKWGYFLWLDYPNAESWRRFNQRKREGVLKTADRIGGEIGIHGVPNEDDSLVDGGTDWTLGCVSMRSANIEELYRVVRSGTRVRIAP